MAEAFAADSELRAAAVKHPSLLPLLVLMLSALVVAHAGTADPESTAACLCALRSLCAGVTYNPAETAGARHAVAVGLVQSLQLLLRSAAYGGRFGDPLVCASALRCLRVVCWDDVARAAVARSEIVSLVASILRVQPRPSVDVCEAAVFALASSGVVLPRDAVPPGTISGPSALVAVGAVDLAVQSLGTCREHVQLHVACVGVLLNIALFDDANRVAALGADMSTVRVVMAALTRWFTATNSDGTPLSDACVKACALLTRLTRIGGATGATVRSTIVAAGGVDTLVAALDSPVCSSSADASRQCLALITRACQEAEPRKHMVAAGGVAATLRTLTRFPRSAEVFTEACRVFGAVAFDALQDASVRCVDGFGDMLTVTLRSFTVPAYHHSLPAKYQALHVLRNLAGGDDASKVLVERSGGLVAALAMMRRPEHESILDVLQAACRVVYNLCCTCNVDILQSLVKLRGVKVLLHTAHRHATDVELLSKCTIVLAAVVIGAVATASDISSQCCNREQCVVQSSFDAAYRGYMDRVSTPRAEICESSESEPIIVGQLDMPTRSSRGDGGSSGAGSVDDPVARTQDVLGAGTAAAGSVGSLCGSDDSSPGDAAATAAVAADWVNVDAGDGTTQDVDVPETPIANRPDEEPRAYELAPNPSIYGVIVQAASADGVESNAALVFNTGVSEEAEPMSTLLMSESRIEIVTGHGSQLDSPSSGCASAVLSFDGPPATGAGPRVMRAAVESAVDVVSAVQGPSPSIASPPLEALVVGAASRGVVAVNWQRRNCLRAAASSLFGVVMAFVALVTALGRRLGGVTAPCRLRLRAVDHLVRWARDAAPPGGSSPDAVTSEASQSDAVDTEKTYVRGSR
jgi:hypothetical protein